MDLRPLIYKKRHGHELKSKEIREFIHHVVEGSTPEYQVSSFLMAVLWRNLSFRETVDLTREMARHGERLKTTKGRKRIGKHSTGGVGDKISFLLGPLVASYGVEVPLMSGRGLGHTGGTIDKLSGIRGIRTALHPKEVHQILRHHGFCIFEQTPRLGPADRKLYALRDATGTVESLPLIVASILSKKILEGLHGLVLDVKYGSGSFMGPLPRAKALARMLLKVAKALRLKATVVLTAMEQPLGRLVGNNLEILECLETFRGHGPEDLVCLTAILASEMLALALPKSKRPSLQELQNRLSSGELEESFRAWLAAQGGRINHTQSLGLADSMVPVRAPSSGWVKSLDARRIGELSMRLGAGRSRVGESIDPKAGIVLHKKVGDPVKKGEVLAELFHSKTKLAPGLLQEMKDAFWIVARPPKRAKLIAGVLKNH